ncbi:MAG: aspartate aminotransferase family protein, partial [Rhodoferax sp.]|nr:aspartate aminotransferase family protein [Rhodoferax sp.]
MNKPQDLPLAAAAAAAATTGGDAALDAFWMPFTANRQFKKSPRLLAKASGMHYWDADGREILDGCAGL